MKKPKKKLLIVILVIIVLIVAGLVVKNIFFATKAKQTVAVQPQTTVLQKGSIISSISASGTIYSGTVENVCSSVSCPVEEIYVEVGDVVKKGQLMATLDMESINTEFQKAQSTLNSAKRDLESKTSEYELDKILHEDGGVSDTDLATAANAVESAKETYSDAQKNYNTIKKELSEGNITSPIDGAVTDSTAEIGLKPSTTGALFVVQDLNDLYVSSTIKEYNLASLKTGQDVLIQTNVTGDTTYKGELTFISPVSASDSTSSNVLFDIKVKITDTNPLMKVGMNAFLAIVLDSKEEVYSVPFDAVVSGQNGISSIYVVKNNIVSAIAVETGIESDTNIEISGDGLANGLVVVTNPSSVTVGQPLGTSNNTTKENASGPMGSRPTDGQAPSSGQTPPSGQTLPSGSTSNGAASQGAANGTQSQQ